MERFAADLTEGGMQRMASRVFACLLASESGALSSKELAERLQVSPAAISGAVRYLSQVRMVSRERTPGSRRDLYRVHPDIWYEAFTDRDRMLDRWADTLAAGAEALGTDTPAGRRLEETRDFFQFMQGELAELLDRWRKHRAERYGE
ncbi:GbsR/MarR family transcriptional regulator [Streptomyces sp. JJ36]|uniref:GbsR/MarR family transcriptional regulator n=1 Tax=Streptomyces sp. JJ36 TaxID=2736645 RepID=UPI001F00D182|nr:MarR family transcriptional regulator [Streptomyces sp. JJ36]